MVWGLSVIFVDLVKKRGKRTLYKYIVQWISIAVTMVMAMVNVKKVVVLRNNANQRQKRTIIIYTLALR